MKRYAEAIAHGGIPHASMVLEEVRRQTPSALSTQGHRPLNMLAGSACWCTTRTDCTLGKYSCEHCTSAHLYAGVYLNPHECREQPAAICSTQVNRQGLVCTAVQPARGQMQQASTSWSATATVSQVNISSVCFQVEVGSRDDQPFPSVPGVPHIQVCCKANTAT
jgi:hypothetical protein